VKREVDREGGMMRRGKAGLEEITGRGNTGRQIAKNRRGREEDKEKHSAVASEQTGLLDKMM
jgi:hypothetical protein